MKKVFVAGAFDGLHVGHQWLVAQAVAFGQVQAVVGRGTTIERLKGRPPHHTDDQRLARLRVELGAYCTHHTAQLGRADGDFAATLTEINPDVIVLGYDQRADEAWLATLCPHAQIVRLGQYHAAWFKSSKFRP